MAGGRRCLNVVKRPLSERPSAFPFYLDHPPLGAQAEPEHAGHAPYG